MPEQAGPAALADAIGGGTLILKHMHDLSDERLRERRVFRVILRRGRVPP
ncbi:MAG: hypothetical protein WBW73_10980 [Rhodoplanes sp.]